MAFAQRVSSFSIGRRRGGQHHFRIIIMMMMMRVATTTSSRRRSRRGLEEEQHKRKGGGLEEAARQRGAGRKHGGKGERRDHDGGRGAGHDPEHIGLVDHEQELRAAEAQDQRKEHMRQHDAAEVGIVVVGRCC